jgi:hypothetical protein
MPQPMIEEVFLRCDPTTAFDLLADVRNEARWNKRVSAAELRSDGPVGEGSRFVTVHLGQDGDITLREFDRPERVIVAGTNPMMDIDTTYTFTAENGGTRLVVTTEVRPKGLTSVLTPLLRVFLRREVAKKYETVKRACEDPDPSTN